MNITDLLSGLGGKVIEGVTDIPKMPPMAGGVTDIPKLPPMFTQAESPAAPQAPQMPPQPPSMNPIGGATPSAPPVTPADAVAAPTAGVPAPSTQPAVRPRSESRDMLRRAAQALIMGGSPAQKVQGFQMLSEAYQLTPEELRETERQRKAADEETERQRKAAEAAALRQEQLAALDQDTTMPPEQKARAKMAILLGAKPEDVLKMATGFTDVDKAGKERAQKLSTWQQTMFGNASTLGQMTARVDRAIELIDKGAMTTGLSGYAAQYVPGSDANKLLEALKPIQAEAGFNRLAQIRKTSESGGGLGSIAVKELEFLQSAEGSLDPVNNTPEDLKANLITMRESKRLFNQLYALAPQLDAGDPKAHEQASALMEQIGALAANIRNAQARDAGQPIRAQSPDDIKGLPSGAKFIAPDGSVRKVP